MALWFSWEPYAVAVGVDENSTLAIVTTRVVLDDDVDEESAEYSEMLYFTFVNDPSSALRNYWAIHCSNS